MHYIASYCWRVCEQTDGQPLNTDITLKSASATHLDSNKPHRAVWCSWIHSQNWANLLDHSNKPSGFLQLSHGRHFGSFIFFYQTCFSTLPSVVHSYKLATAYTTSKKLTHSTCFINIFYCFATNEILSNLNFTIYPFGAGIIFFLISAHLYIKCE